MSFERIDLVQDQEERAFLESLKFSSFETLNQDMKTRFGWLSGEEFSRFAGFYNWRELQEAPFYSALDKSDGCIYRWYKDGRKQLMIDASGNVITPADVFLE